MILRGGGRLRHPLCCFPPPLGVSLPCQRPAAPAGTRLESTGCHLSSTWPHFHRSLLPWDRKACWQAALPLTVLLGKLPLGTSAGPTCQACGAPARPHPVGRWALSGVQVSPGSREGQGTALLGAHLSARQPVHCLFFEGFYGPALPRGERNPGETSVPASQGGLGLYTCSPERMVPVQSHKEMAAEMGPRGSVSAPGPESPVTRGESGTPLGSPPGKWHGASRDRLDRDCAYRALLPRREHC